SRAGLADGFAGRAYMPPHRVAQSVAAPPAMRRLPMPMIALARRHPIPTLVLAAVAGVALLGAVALAALPHRGASAAPAALTRGEVEAIFNTRFTACDALIVHRGVAANPPCALASRGPISPLIPGR